MSEPTTQASPHVEINAQYLKDLSFESPRAPMSLVATGQEKPSIDLSINIAAERVQEHSFEVSLHITAKAMQGSDPVFLADVTFAGLFTIQDLPEDQRDIMLFVFCPTMLFPFARRVVADVTRDGGFPPLMLNPIDFMTLYKQRGATQSAPAGEVIN